MQIIRVCKIKDTKRAELDEKRNYSKINTQNAANVL